MDGDAAMAEAVPALERENKSEAKAASAPAAAALARKSGGGPDRRVRVVVGTYVGAVCGLMADFDPAANKPVRCTRGALRGAASTDSPLTHAPDLVRACRGEVWL